MKKLFYGKYFRVPWALILSFIFLSSCSGFDQQLMYNEAQRAHNQKEFEKAIKLYEKLLKDDPLNKIHPDNAIISYDLGVAYLDSGARNKTMEQIQYLRRLGRKDLADELGKLAQISDSF